MYCVYYDALNAAMRNADKCNVQCEMLMYLGITGAWLDY